MSGKATRTQRRRQRVRDDILDATRDLILDVGVGGVTLAAIAGQLELTKPALYYYFKSKDDLLFELVFESMSKEIEVLAAAVDAATSGSQAIEGIIRACSAHYANNVDAFRMTYLATQVGSIGPMPAEQLERVRPFNELVYGAAEKIIRADQEAGVVGEHVNPRRAAFLAHMGVLGVLTMEGMIASGDTGPLIHSHDDMIDDLVRIHTGALAVMG